MESIAKEEKKFKLNSIKGQIQSILKILVDLNKNKALSYVKFIRVLQVKYQIFRMLKRKNRLIKVYWAINLKNTQYKQSGGLKEYSARDIYNIVINILKKDGHKKVSKRTIQRDIKLLNEMGLLKSKIIRLGENKGSIAHYKQNMQLAHLHKEIISEYLLHLLKESLSDKKIIGDFDKEDENEDEDFNYENLEKFNILSKVNDESVMSHRCESDDFNKANISYINNKNSIENSKEMLSKKIVTSTQKIKKCKFERQDVESRLISIQKIDKKYLKQIKELCNNDATYINALINLETAIIEYKNEYNIENILEHFLKQFSNRYKHKVWMMMKRKDGVISDYELIWEGRFRDWYPNKYKSGHVVKETYGENIRVENKILNTQISNQISNNLQHKRDNELEKLENEKEKKKRRLELKRREEYLKKLFEQEAQEMQERLRKAREEKERLKEHIKENMIDNLEKNDRITTSDSIVGDNNLIGFNSGLNSENSNNLSNYQPICESLCKPSGPAAAAMYPRINLKVNYEGVKTTKGMKISLDSLGINSFSNQEKNTIKEKGEIV